MRSLKAAWLTPWEGSGLYSLSLESANPEPEHMRLKSRNLAFPERPTRKNPRRHTLTVGLMDEDDLRLLRDVLDRFLEAE